MPPFEIGRPLPPWHLVGPDGAEVPEAAAFAGRPLLLLFFSLHCPGSTARAVPFANRVVVERGACVQVVGILTDDEAETSDEASARAQERLYVRFPVYRDAGLSATAHAYGTGGTPHWVLVGPSGTVIRSLFGSEPDRTLLRLDYQLDELEGQSVVGFGGGCHWCTEAVFQQLRGVETVEQGWVRSAPPHEAWSEAVVVHFRPDEIGLETLLAIHLLTHASTSRHSMRAKYRSAVYTFGPEQQRAAQRLLKRLAQEDGAAYVTEALPFAGFRMNTPGYLDYYRTRPDAPFCTTYIDPKLQTLRERYGRHVKPEGAAPGQPLAAAAGTEIPAAGLTWREVVRRVNHGNPPPPRRVERTDAAWRALLPEDVYRVTRQRGTEGRHHSELCTRFAPGRYACRCCGAVLFDGGEKIGGGWPTFTQPAEAAPVAYHKDTSGGGARVEAACAVCDAHLGHVSPDGPAPGGLRYCINGAALAVLGAPPDRSASARGRAEAE